MFKKPQRRVNYLNNHDILAEIHKSKMSYCYYNDEKYYNYDVILNDVNDISYELAENLVPSRVKRLNEIIIRQYQSKNNCTARTALNACTTQNLLVLEQDVAPNDVVFRIMTTEHIPDEYLMTDRSRNMKLNFNSFKHFVIDNSGDLQEVARSHWVGTFDNGEFSIDHGYLTNKLGKMFIMLTDKIATKPNYRGYTFIDEMKADARFQLTKNALLFNESQTPNKVIKKMHNLEKSAAPNPFAYYTTIVNNSFKAILNSEKRIRDFRDDILEEMGFTPSTTRQNDMEQRMLEQKEQKNNGIQ